MGKVRLECPHCGKAIRVSDTAKKAKCPGCKKVIDVAALVAGAGGEEAEQPAAEKAPPSGPTGEEAVAVAPPPKKPSKRSSRRMKAAAKVPPKAAPTIAGIQSWMIVAALSVVLFVVLFLFYLQWWAALMIASAVGVYVDASLCRITRVGPSSPGSSVGPMIWGLIAFALGVGPLIYILLRAKLRANSAEDIAEADATQEDLEETGKVRAPSLASPGVLLVLVVALGLGAMSLKKPSLQIRLGERFRRTTKTVVRSKSNPRDIYDSKKEFHVAITANKAFDEGEYKTLTWIVFLRSDDEQTPLKQGEVTWDEEVAKPGSRKRLWHWKVQVDEAGIYVLKVMHGEDSTFITKEFRTRSVN